MIQTEMLNDNTLIRHYSDEGFKLLQIETGIIYDEAVDIYPCPYTYEETDEKIEPTPDEEDENEEITGDVYNDDEQ